MHYEILDERRRTLLPLLAKFKKDFYLAGGTALALQIGHRDSIDFDFFSPEAVDTSALFAALQEVCAGHSILKTQEEKNTLSVLIEDEVRVSFFAYSYKMVRDLIDEPYLSIASKEDIACMKLSAVTSRATEKDYADIYFLLKEYSLQTLLDLARDKFPQLDTSLILKSLVYFDDVVTEPIRFTAGHEVDFSTVQEEMRKVVADLIRHST